MYTDTKQMSVIIITNDLYLCCNTSHKLSGTTNYRIAGTFEGENFHGLLACAVPKNTMPPNFAEKTFANNHKTAKFAKVFSLKSFPLSVSLPMISINASNRQFGVF